MQETTSKCRALFRPALCVWLSLVLALSPALRPRQAKAIAFADDVGLALMVLSVLGYGVAAWQYSADQTSVDQLAATLSSFPTEAVGAAVHDGFLYVSELTTSTLQQVGTWYNNALGTLTSMGSPLVAPNTVPLSGDFNGYYTSSYVVGGTAMYNSVAASLASSTLPNGVYLFSMGNGNGSVISCFATPDATVTITNYGSSGKRVTVRATTVQRFSANDTYANGYVGTASASDTQTWEYNYTNSGGEFTRYWSPFYQNLLRGAGLNVTSVDGTMLQDVPDAIAGTQASLRTGDTPVAQWPDAVAGMGDVVVAPVPTETPTSVPSEDWGEWVWTPADDEALADWIERHKTGTTPDPDPDPEDPEDPEREAMPVPIPWWWPWDEPAEDVWPDIKQRIDEWTDPSFDPSPSADPDAGPGDGIGSLPANPDGPTPDPDPDKPTGDKTWDDIGYDLSHVFPFCLPFDLSRLLGLLVTDPVTPVLSWATPDPAGGNVTMTIDLTPWDPVAAAVRKVEILLFAAYLIVKTRDIMS